MAYRCVFCLLSHSTVKMSSEQNIVINISLKMVKQIAVLLITAVCISNANRHLNPKTILLWTPLICSDCSPNGRFGSGNQVFRNQGCEFQNCYIETTRGNLTDIDDVSGFDAILFNGRPILRLKPNELPQTRSLKQFYVFVQLESADRFPVCNQRFDDFFNWTMSYRPNSDMPWPYLTVQNTLNQTVGPKSKKTSWKKDMAQIDNMLRNRLKGKRKLAAWFVSYCNNRSGRLTFATELNKILQSKYNQTVDIYGECGTLQCFKNETERCHAMIRDDYLFYLAFENSFAVDYVTEKLLTALRNSAIPVLLGDVGYSKFAPPGSYLNALALGPELLADTMMDLMLHRTRTYDYFRWTNHYHYTEQIVPPVCQLCAKLNTGGSKRYRQFRKWWNVEYLNRCPECVKKGRTGRKRRRNCLRSTELRKKRLNLKNYGN